MPNTTLPQHLFSKEEKLAGWCSEQREHSRHVVDVSSSSKAQSNLSAIKLDDRYPFVFDEKSTMNKLLGMLMDELMQTPINVYGPSGVGKTRLIVEAAKWLH